MGNDILSGVFAFPVLFYPPQPNSSFPLLKLKKSEAPCLILDVRVLRRRVYLRSLVCLGMAMVTTTTRKPTTTTATGRGRRSKRNNGIKFFNAPRASLPHHCHCIATGRRRRTAHCCVSSSSSFSLLSFLPPFDVVCRQNVPKPTRFVELASRISRPAAVLCRQWPFSRKCITLIHEPKISEVS